MTAWPPCRRMLAAAAAALATALAGCASAPPAPAPDDTGTIVAAPFDIDGQAYDAHWYLPAGEAPALVVLQPGFTRRCAHLRGTTRQLMAGGLMALCVDAPMTGGNPRLADALASRLAAGPAEAPGGRPVPHRIIVAGHSAGASFAARLGQQLGVLAPQRLAGALLFDPVSTRGLEDALRAVSDTGRRPVLAVLATPHRCNAGLSAAPALQRLRAEAMATGRGSFVSVQLTEGSTHADVEGDDSDWMARTACGRPLPANVALLRSLAVQWAQAVARGAAPAAPAGAGWRLME